MADFSHRAKQGESLPEPHLGIGHELAEGHDETTCADCQAWAIQKVRKAMVRPMADEIAALLLLARAAALARSKEPGA